MPVRPDRVYPSAWLRTREDVRPMDAPRPSSPRRAGKVVRMDHRCRHAARSLYLAGTGTTTIVSLAGLPVFPAAPSAPAAPSLPFEPAAPVAPVAPAGPAGVFTSQALIPSAATMARGMISFMGSFSFGARIASPMTSKVDWIRLEYGASGRKRQSVFYARSFP